MQARQAPDTAKTVPGLIEFLLSRVLSWRCLGTGYRTDFCEAARDLMRSTSWSSAGSQALPDLRCIAWALKSHCSASL